MPWKQRGPLSLSGIASSAPEEAPPAAELRLRVTSSDAVASGAAVSADALPDWDWEASAPFLQLASGSDCAVRLARSADVAAGCLRLSAVCQHNLHVLPPESYSFSVFEPTATLAELCVECRLLSRDAGAVELEAAQVSAALRERCGLLHAVGEVILLNLDSLELRLRVAEAHTLCETLRREEVAYHSYRGLLTPETAIHLTAESGLTLLGNPARTELPPSANCVTVHTSDGECYVVPARVLRPCIALTRAIRAAGPSGGSEVTVAVDCLVFDRVLIYLEALSLGHPAPTFSLTLIDDLHGAATMLGLRSLEEHCLVQQDAFATRLREYSLSEVVQANEAGACLLIIDGMVLDVKAWLPEHPGGSTIIPAQSLNCDAARHFGAFIHRF